MRNELLLAGLMIVAGCGARASSPAPATTAAASPAPRIVFPDGFAVKVEIASDDSTRQQGLMYRDRLAEDHGMIFLFTQSGEYPFWMKNTLIPLDMIWIDDQKKIAHISRDVPPCPGDPCPNYPPNATAKYVLEVAAGVAKKHHLAAGNTMRFEGLDHVMVQ